MLKFVENHPALIVEDGERKLVVADLHIGFEEELRGKGIRIPLQSHRLVEELCSLAAESGARKIVVVGDFKHNVTGPSPLETEQIPRYLRKLREVVDEVVIIPGNHDGRIGDIVGGLASVAPARGVLLGEVALVHGHLRPDKKLLEARVMVTGHLHPVLRIGGGEAGLRVRVWLRMKADRKKLYKALYGDEEGVKRGEITLLIMPSFNNALQGRSITDLALTKLVRGSILNTGVFSLEEAEVISLDGSVLGNLGTLRELI